FFAGDGSFCEDGQEGLHIQILWRSGAERISGPRVAMVLVYGEGHVGHLRQRPGRGGYFEWRISAWSAVGTGATNQQRSREQEQDDRNDRGVTAELWSPAQQRGRIGAGEERCEPEAKENSQQWRWRIHG